MKALLVSAVAVLAWTAPAGAQGPLSVRLQADKAQAGRIGLTLTGPPRASLRVDEDIAGGSRRIADVVLDERGKARLPRAATWNCKERERSFQAQGQTAEGIPLADSARIFTPGCRDRYRLRPARRRVRATKPLKVEARDTFALAKPDGTKLCAKGPGGLEVCERLKRGRATLRLPRAGTWRLNAKQAAPVRVRVRPRPGPVKVLATGDSMIQIVDGFLDQRIGNVTSDARISTGLSKPFFFDWPAHAKRQVARLHPDVTVMFIGANDGYPFGDAACCGKAWRRAYANRVSAMMRTYEQRGAGTVYWCLLPAPRPANFRRVFVAVNAAIKRGATRHRGTSRVVDLAKTFTPGYRFRQYITWRGRSVSVRQDDGIHLNVAGASIAASLITERMRRDGVLGRAGRA